MFQKQVGKDFLACRRKHKRPPKSSASLKNLKDRKIKKRKWSYVSKSHTAVTALYAVRRTYALRVLAFMKHSRRIFGCHHKTDETTSFDVVTSKTTSFVNVQFIRRSVTYVPCVFCVNAPSPLSHLKSCNTCGLVFGCVPIQIVQGCWKVLSPTRKETS